MQRGEELSFFPLSNLGGTTEYFKEYLSSPAWLFFLLAVCFLAIKWRSKWPRDFSREKQLRTLKVVFCYFRYPGSSNQSFQSRSAELLHYHQQRHYSKRGRESRRPRIQLDGSPGDVLPLRGVRQPRGGHQAAETPGSVLQVGRQDSAQRTVNGPLLGFPFGFICLLGLKCPKETSGRDVLIKIHRCLLEERASKCQYLTFPSPLGSLVSASSSAPKKPSPNLQPALLDN